MSPQHEPHKTKTVRRVTYTTLVDRRRHLAAAHFNVMHLTQDQVTFDLSSLGTSAMSQDQQAGLYLGDEAYAGKRSFDVLQHAAREVLGTPYVCATHNLLGCLKRVVGALLPTGTALASNARDHDAVLAPRGVEVVDVRDRGERVFTGNLDVSALDALLASGAARVVLVEAFADGQHPVSYGNLVAVQRVCLAHEATLVLDASRLMENAWYVQQHEPSHAGTIAEIMGHFAGRADVVQLDGAQAAKVTAGGLLATEDADIYARLMGEVVAYEGLHTYGGMPGRSMEVLARGLREMADEAEAAWVMGQTTRFTERLRAAGVPLERGCDGAYLHADTFLPHLTTNRQDALSAALYLVSGVRAFSPYRRQDDTLVPVQLPRLALANAQVDEIADAIAHLYAQRAQVAALLPIEEGPWRDQQRYRSAFTDLQAFTFNTRPWTVHTVEPIGRLDRAGRARAIAEAGYNPVLLRSDSVAIDLLTDSGTSARSTDQWAAFELARATASASVEHRRLVETLRAALGYAYVIPTHQGRAAERILRKVAIGPGQAVVANRPGAVDELERDGTWIDVGVAAAADPTSDHPWKGDVDLDRLAAVIAERGRAGLAYLSIELAADRVGGQPVGMDTLRAVYRLCSGAGLPVFFDATRAVENAGLIQRRDPRFADTPVGDILREMLLYGDGCTLSAKKDVLSDQGGLLAFHSDATLAARAREVLRVYGGHATDGGLSTTDMAAMARGVEEMVDDRMVRARLAQTERLAARLEAAGVPIVRPAAAGAVFLDARRFLPHVDATRYPAQRLAAEVYVEAGVRALEQGTVSVGRDPATGRDRRPPLALVRLAIPRRVYSDDHLAAVADGVIAVWARRDQIGGLRFLYEPQRLRGFQGRFAPDDASR